MLSHDLMDSWAHLNSPVHRLDARVKLLCATVLIVAILAVPVARNPLLGAYAALLLAVLATSRLPAGWVLGRLAILAPFLLLGTIAALLVPSPQALAIWVSVGAKCLLCLLAAVLLAGTNTSADLLRAAQALHIPRTLTALSGFAITYLAVLADEAGRMLTAMRSRGRMRGLRRRLHVGASPLATLMVRAAERADRIALAMVARGYRGTMPALAPERVPAGQWAIAGVTVAIAAGMTWLGVVA
jgi:cobalt/nickel transport system permease protein